MHRCSGCEGEVQDEFRFCPHCGQAQRTKIVEYFRGHPEVGDGHLRASMYLTEPRHVRLSVWRGDAAQAVISLDPEEMRRLGRFLLDTPQVARRGIARMLARL